jgi:hypothetical protein
MIMAVLRNSIVLLGFVSLVLPCATATADALEVGPGRKYGRLSSAVAAAKDGDAIEIAAGDYTNDWCKIRVNNLTVRGVGNGRARFVSQGMIDNRKGIWVVSGNDLTVENVEFIGARVDDRNGAGIRPDGRGLTVRHCRFYDCEDGIQGGGGEVLIEHCEFDHCGHSAGSVATHSVYISQRCTKLTFRYNYSHQTVDGHLLKTRAQESWVLYNRLTDEDGGGSAVADFPNGGFVVMVGNVLHKGPNGHNNRCIAFGMEGLKNPRNEIYVVNNTMQWANRRANEAWFVRVENRAPKPPAGSPAGQPETKDVKVVIRNNICVGPLKLTNAAKFEEAGNLLFKTMDEAGLVDPARYDFALKAGSPAIDKGVDPGKADDFLLRPQEEYLHPCNSRKRPDDGKLDVGAFEFVAGSR